jgi:hypothetical protein
MCNALFTREITLAALVLVNFPPLKSRAFCIFYINKASTINLVSFNSAISIKISSRKRRRLNRLIRVVTSIRKRAFNYSFPDKSSTSIVQKPDQIRPFFHTSTTVLINYWHVASSLPLSHILSQSFS